MIGVRVFCVAEDKDCWGFFMRRSGNEVVRGGEGSRVPSVVADCRRAFMFPDLNMSTASEYIVSGEHPYGDGSGVSVLVACPGLGSAGYADGVITYSTGKNVTTRIHDAAACPS